MRKIRLILDIPHDQYELLRKEAGESGKIYSLIHKYIKKGLDKADRKSHTPYKRKKIRTS